MKKAIRPMTNQQIICVKKVKRHDSGSGVSLDSVQEYESLMSINNPL